MFHMKNMTEQEIEEWVISADRIWEMPIDNSITVSGSSTFRTITETLFVASPTDPSYLDLFRFVKIAL